MPHTEYTYYVRVVVKTVSLAWTLTDTYGDLWSCLMGQVRVDHQGTRFAYLREIPAAELDIGVVGVDCDPGERRHSSSSVV